MNLSNFQDTTPIQRLLQKADFIKEWRGFKDGRPLEFFCRRFRVSEASEMMRHTLKRRGFGPNDQVSLSLDKKEGALILMLPSGSNVTCQIDSLQALLLLRHFGIHGTECPLCHGPTSYIPNRSWLND